MAATSQQIPQQVGGVGAQGHAAEPLRLAVDPILVELDFKKVGHSAHCDGLLEAKSEKELRLVEILYQYLCVWVP